MLRRIRVQGFKSLHDVEVELAPLTVLIGPNAAGKSNLLEAILLLSRLGTERTLEDAFGSPLRGHPLEAFTVSEEGLPGLLQKKSARLSIEAEVQPTEHNPLRYRIEVQIRPKTGSFEVVDEYLQRLRQDFKPWGKQPRLEREDHHLVIRQLGQAGTPRHEALGLNHTLLSNLQLSGKTRFPDFDALRQELGSWRIYYLDPRIAMRTPQPPRETEHIGLSGELIAPFLHRLKESHGHNRHFQAIGRALQRAIPTVEDLAIDLDPQRGTLEITVTQNGTPYSSRVISEGTLRVLALCSIAANPYHASLIAFEEPETGVHPRRIEVIAGILHRMAQNQQRQVVITTHSTRLIKALAALREDREVAFLRSSQDGLHTVVRPFTPEEFSPLFLDLTSRQALASPEDQATVEAIVERGWDG